MIKHINMHYIFYVHVYALIKTCFQFRLCLNSRYVFSWLCFKPRHSFNRYEHCLHVQVAL